MEEYSPSQDLGGHPVSAPERADFEAIVRDIAALPTDPTQLTYDSVNIQFASGALSKELRRSAVVSMKTLRDIVYFCRDAVADGPSTGQDGREPWSRDEPISIAAPTSKEP